MLIGTKPYEVCVPAFAAQVAPALDQVKFTLLYGGNTFSYEIGL